jgi:hypothetical protein
MKPENWDSMTEQDKREDAERLFNSVRGRLVIGQAIARAAAVMRKEKYPETSNIEDMEELGEMLFNPFYSMYTPEGQAAQARALELLRQKL